jgi:hypothetical protein
MLLALRRQSFASPLRQKYQPDPPPAVSDAHRSRAIPERDGTCSVPVSCLSCLSTFISSIGEWDDALLRLLQKMETEYKQESSIRESIGHSRPRRAGRIRL